MKLEPKKNQAAKFKYDDKESFVDAVFCVKNNYQHRNKIYNKIIID